MPGNSADSHGDLAPQFILAIIVNVISFTYGMMIGWLSPMQPLLQANYTGTNLTSPFGEGVEPMTDEQVSWIGGCFCIGGTFGSALYAYLANAYGRKKTLLMAGIPFVFCFALFVMATNMYYIFVSRIIAGIAGGGVCLIIPMYVGETAEPVIRGVLGAFFNLLICAGILASFIIGSFTSYTFLSMTALVCPVAFLVGYIWLPETPIYSIMNNRMDEARTTLRKIRGNHKDLIEQELSCLSASLKDGGEEESMSLLDMVREPATRKGLIIGVVLMLVQQFSGVSPIINYTVTIFKASGSNISPNISTIIVGILQLVGASVSTIFMDRGGRKFFLMISGLGMAMTLAPIAIFFHLKSTDADEEFMASIGWVPVTSMAIFIVVYALGFGPVPFLILAELFRVEARSTATSICVTAVWFFSFFFLKFFANMQDLLGTDTCFGVFSICCLLGVFFTWFYIPETKGKTLEMILWELGGHEKVSDMERSSPIPLVLDEKTRDIIIPYSNGKQKQEGKLESA